jgi:hypothetical protein
VNRPGIVITRSVGVRFVRRNKKHFTGRDSESASIDYGPAFTFGAKDQDRFIKPVEPLDPVPARFGIPSEAFDVKADTERMPADMAEQIGGQKMDDLTWKPLCLVFH